MKSKFLIVLMIGIFVLSACVQEPGAGVSTPTQGVVSTPTTGPIQPVPTETKVPVDLTPAQRAALEAASQKYKIPVEQIKIVSTEAVTWTNGCLDVVIPGVMCTQALVDGFRIILEANGKSYEFHTNQDGTNVVDAAQLQATLGFVVAAPDGTVQIINPNIPLGPTYNPAFTGFLPRGGSVLGTAYVLDQNFSKAISINEKGSTDLSFIQKPTYGLAVWNGFLAADVSPKLAWGTTPTGSETPSTLQVSGPDGSNLETIYTETTTSTLPTALVAQFWSADGKSLYFSKEPTGLGGYITFSGASNLYKIDLASKQVSEIIPMNSSGQVQTCLDAISGDYRYVADHCVLNVITIRDLQGGSSVTLKAPTDISGYQVMGSARFSPDGKQVAFALDKRNPDDEQGWVAVGSSAGGESKTILVGKAGSYYNVLGWLDDNTLLVQSFAVMCSTNCANEIYTVGADGSNPTKVADGTFLAVVDNR